MRLLRAKRKPPPRSVTSMPKFSPASTFDQAAGSGSEASMA